MVSKEAYITIYYCSIHRKNILFILKVSSPMPISSIKYFDSLWDYMDTVIEQKGINPLLNEVKELPSPPAVAIRILEEVKKDNASINKLARIISHDPALTTKILKIANSSFYGLPNKIESIDRAINVIGLDALKNIALSFVIVKEFRRSKTDRFDFDFFWRRSITAAVSAGLLAEFLNIKRDDIFVTPLLMDIGVVVMYLIRPHDYLRVIEEKQATEKNTIEAERLIYGCTHAEVGGELLRRWKIPEEIYIPIRFHHTPEECPPEFKEMVKILIMADLTSSVYHGGHGMEKFGILQDMMKDEIGINDEEIENYIDTVAERTLETLSNFEIDSGNMKPYSQILQEANEELGKLNLSYEQLVLELRREKRKVEELARELKEANEILRGMAFRDGLTGLYNHRYFQEQLQNEIARCERYNHPLALIMIDIDHFKKVNDTYGHPNGDIVLKSIADFLSRSVRKSDIVARYGGEEFALILPETDIKGAVTQAERLRKGVQKMEIILNNNQKLHITISLGVSMYEPWRGRKKKTDLIDTADRALYKSKQSGRNRVSVIT